MPHSTVATGLDVLVREGFAPLRHRQLGLICNHSAIDRHREHLIDLTMRAGCGIIAFYSPEHGLQGRLDEPVQSGMYGASGLVIHSLYGAQQRPTPEMLTGVETLVYDIADIGVRFYTYPTTMVHCLAAAAEAGLPFYVLDRPNPIRGDVVEGPVLDKPFSSLAAWHPFPLRHGLTSGEIARWANERYGIGADLRVIACEGWQRGQWFHETGLPWVNPSPNMRNVRQTLLYPAIGTLEFCALSVGRGTDTPFEVFGAPWIEDALLAETLNATGLAGMHFVPIVFRPTTREFAGQECRGVYVVTEEWNAVEPVTAAVQIALTLKRLWPEQFDHTRLAHLLGSQAAVAAIGRLEPAASIVAGWQEEVARFRSEREACLLY